MPSYRLSRIEDEMKKTISDILYDVKDYRVAESMITITHVTVAPDLSEAKVFFSFMGGEYEPKEVRKGLMSAQGFIRSQVAKRMNLRQTPKFTFNYDDSMVNGAKINKLILQVEEELKIADERDRKIAEEESISERESENDE